MSNTSSRKQRNKSSKKRTGNNRELILADSTSFPKTLSCIAVRHGKIRFRSSGTVVSRDIYRRDLLNLIFTCPNGLFTGLSIIGSILLRKVEVWSMPLPGDLTNYVTSVNVTMESANGPFNRKTDTGNPNTPAHVVMVPPRNSLASFWSGPTSTLSETLFNIDSTSPVSTIVDVEFDFTINDGLCRVVTPTGAPAAAVLATNNLDNSTSTGLIFAGSNLFPVGLSSLVAYG